jgi:hypothetical protein
MSLLKPDFENVIIPEWVRFIAQDSDGSWWGYSVEPLENHRGWYENEVGKNIKLQQTVINKEWKKSLFSYVKDNS